MDGEITNIAGVEGRKGMKMGKATQNFPVFRKSNFVCCHFSLFMP